MDVAEAIDINRIKFASLIMNPRGSSFSFKIDSIPLSLFYCLIKEILDLPMVILEYQDCQRVNIGISLDDSGIKGDLLYKGRTFLICDLSKSNLELSEEIIREVFVKSSFF